MVALALGGQRQEHLLQASPVGGPELGEGDAGGERGPSDDGQLGWLAGYCHPIRFNDMSQKGKVPADLLAKLPDPALYAKAVFPTLDEQKAASDITTKQWDSVVGANVQ